MTKDLPRRNKDSFFSELLIFAAQVGKVSDKFAKVSKELDSTNGCSTLLSGVKGALYFGGACPSAA